MTRSALRVALISVIWAVATAGAAPAVVIDSQSGGGVWMPVAEPAAPPIGSKATFRAHVQLMPEGLRSMLRSGIALRVSSNQLADGIVTLSVSRRDARQAHIHVGRAPTVVIGRGTVSRVKSGTVTLHVRLSRATAARLRHLRHIKVTMRVSLVGAGGTQLAVDAAGRY